MCRQLIERLFAMSVVGTSLANSVLFEAYSLKLIEALAKFLLPTLYKSKASFHVSVPVITLSA